ncbi:hypothetical protein [Thalassotalea crassostreae]|uniref:hypothetical protein n=1 Tax=Thalassotalea crassostreae TaxID=1763536 RepID=UPI0008380117|nr:hypothetical protein [Thalassotalea crassostreae]
MKNILKPTKFLIVTTLLLTVIYQMYFWLMPQVSIKNELTIEINKTTINLPNNKIVFSSITKGATAAIYYALEQNKGSYQYHFKLEDGDQLTGQCGSVKKNELTKAILFTVTIDKTVICSEN